MVMFMSAYLTVAYCSPIIRACAASTIRCSAGRRPGRDARRRVRPVQLRARRRQGRGPALLRRAPLFKLGVSWGGHESLAFPAAAGLEQEGAANPLRDFGVAPETIRLHIGLEDPDDLWSDLAQALERSAA